MKAHCADINVFKQPHTGAHIFSRLYTTILYMNIEHFESTSPECIDRTKYIGNADMHIRIRLIMKQE